MPRSNNIFWNVALPVVLFMSLSFTANSVLFGHLKKAGLLNLQDSCPIPSLGNSPFQLQYLGGYAPVVENTLCILVAFFHPVFQPGAAPTTPFISSCGISFSAIIAVPFVEASRRGRPFLLAFPVILGTLYQMFSGAVVYPIFWVLLLTTTRDQPVGSMIDQANAEATLFGLVLGYGLPSISMVYFATPVPIALWQVFPVLISAFRRIHLLIRPSRTNSGSGYRTTQATYIMTFIASAIAHIHTLAAYNFDPQIIMDMFIPSLAIPDAAKGHTGLTSAVHFLRWDFAFIVASTFLATLWFAESILQGIQLLTWILVSSPILGPGAAVSGIFLWREAKLNQARLQLAAPKPAKFQ